MTYLYTQDNRLEKLHNYMYASFQGGALLRAYLDDRTAVLREYGRRDSDGGRDEIELVTLVTPILEEYFGTAGVEAEEQYRASLDKDNCAFYELAGASVDTLTKYVRPLSCMTLDKTVKTIDLLHGLIAAQVQKKSEIDVKIWLDRLVQRFEVTKKLYKIYLPGFRKGDGSNTSLRLYWLFSVALCLYYAKTDEIKYLSTLLKVCDLLCSVPNSRLREEVSDVGLFMVVLTELGFVQSLAEKMEVSLVLA